MQLLTYLSRWSPSSLSVSGIVFIGIIGVFDYVTGPEISCSIFYLIPIALVTWLLGRRHGLGLCIVGTLIWLTADVLGRAGYSHPAMPYWNATVRLGFFLIVTYILVTLRESHKRQEELGQFVVHDLRSPLAVVVTGLQTMQDIAGEAMDTTQKELIEMCLTSCDRMLTLINSLLDLARLESAQLPLQLEEVAVQELVEASVRQVSAWAERNRVTMVRHLDSDSEHVYADAIVTARVLINLLSNAVRFSQANSTVSVHVAPYRAEAVAFSITDQGRGMAKEWQAKVFDKYAQAEVGKARGTVGSGLGLTFCRLAVEAQGGHIWLESELNVGTTVTFTLPRRRT